MHTFILAFCLLCLFFHSFRPILAAPEPLPVGLVPDISLVRPQRLHAHTRPFLNRHDPTGKHADLPAAAGGRARSSASGKPLKAAEYDAYAFGHEHPEDPIPSESGMSLGPSSRPPSTWHIDPKNPICVCYLPSFVFPPPPLPLNAQSRTPNPQNQAVF